jgi:hypothetical protein
MKLPHSFSHHQRFYIALCTGRTPVIMLAESWCDDQMMTEGWGSSQCIWYHLPVSDLRDITHINQSPPSSRLRSLL